MSDLEMQEYAEALRDKVVRLEQRVKQMEEAGNQLKDRYILENENWDLNTVNNWNAAKEAKP